MNSNDKEVIRFIDRLYRDLYLSEDVLRHSTHNKTDKFNNLKEYLDMLESMHDRVLKSPNRVNIIKKLYFDKYIIKEEDVPISYYQMFVKMNFERGFGLIPLEDIGTHELAENVIIDQIVSLNSWLNYFLSEESKDCPFWAKYWAFQGVLRLGKFNKKTGRYNRRTRDTIAPFVEFNKEALSASIELIKKQVKKENIEDKELKEMVSSGSFEKIYLKFLGDIMGKNNDSGKANEGKWVKYKRGSDYQILVNDLRGHNTCWCTANESSARRQLKSGDFYVYYTLDSNNQYKIPRIAISMGYNNSFISEIRGIENEQSLEPEMVDIAKEKAKELYDRRDYFTLERNTNRLTEIYNKFKSNIELTEDEVRFLYDTDIIKVGLGSDDDPRIEEIKKKRSLQKDLALIYKCAEKDVALTKEEITKNTKVFVGDWDNTFESTILPEVVIGDIHLPSVNSEGVKLPRIVKGGLYLEKLKDAKGLVLPEMVSGDLYLTYLESPEGLVLPKYVGGYLNLAYITSLDGVKLPDTLDSILLSSLKSGKGLIFPEKMNGTLEIHSNIDLKDVKFPRIIGKNLYLSHVVNIENTQFPEVVFGQIYLGSARTIKNVIFPKRVGDDFSLEDLISAENVVFPSEVYGDLSIERLQFVSNVTLPDYVSGDVDLRSLHDGNGLVLPKCIDKDLYLSPYLDLSTVILPEEIQGYVYWGKHRMSLSTLKDKQESHMVR